MKKLILICALILGFAGIAKADWDSSTNMQTETVSAAFTQVQNCLKAIDGTTGTIPANIKATTFTGNLTGNLTGNVTGNVTGSSGSCTGNAATATTAGTVTTAAQPAITSVGTLSDLTVTAPITGSVTGSSGSTTGNAATVTTNANLSGDVSSSGNTTTINTSKVTSTMLKTATSEVSTFSGDGNGANTTPSGGSYCFYPQFHATGTDTFFSMLVSNNTAIGTSYITNVSFRNTTGSGQCYAQFRYVTSSGEDYWLWFLIDKTTKDILSMAGAPDHPAYGNSNDFDKQPHPFNSYAPNTMDIILIEKDQAKAIQQEAKDKNLSVLELVNKDYKIDFIQTYPYVPMHSGQFSPEHAPVMVEKIPSYISIRKLILATDKDKEEKKSKQEQRQQQYEQEKIQKQNKIKNLQDKLNLTDEEFNLLKEKVK